jgi:large subunit ribosomal protein L9
MRILLLKDVYKLGRAGDVKKVADGYGRNYLIPQNLAVLATPGALKQVEHIRSQAAATRAVLNQEMSGVAEQLSEVVLTFPAKAGDTGKLYGSITPQMIADAIQAKVGVEIDRRQLDSQPIRTLGEHQVHIRLTVDLIPVVSVIVHREGESPSFAAEEAEELAQPVDEEVEMAVEASEVSETAEASDTAEEA